MEVIPAIDLRMGRVVRLYQGDFSKETVYSDAPVDVALRWQASKAPRIHIVDLDGAVTGRLANFDILKEIVAAVDIPVQVGGGIRDLDTALELIHIGIQRVVFGTVAVRDPSLVKSACDALGRDAVVVGVDVRGAKVAVDGWVDTVSENASRLVKNMAQLGVNRFIYTDIAADGTLGGPSVNKVIALMQETNANIIASGGIGSMKDLRRIGDVGVEGVIVGRALYTGMIDLGEAVKQFAVT